MAGHLAAHLHQPGRFDSGVDGQLADAVDHVAQLALETIVAGGQLADFVVGVYRHVVRQIARALAVLIQQGDDLAQRGDSQVAQIPHPAQGSHRQHGQGGPDQPIQDGIIQLERQICGQCCVWNKHHEHAEQFFGQVVEKRAFDLTVDSHIFQTLK